MASIRLILRYDGLGPVYWSGGPGDFGLQDKAGTLHQGEAAAEGVVAFDLTLEVKPGDSGSPILVGSFAHGPPGGRFLYLGWRNANGAFAQRLKIPLGSIGWDEVRHAGKARAPLVCDLVDRSPKATRTGANIGGTRHVSWRPRAAEALTTADTAGPRQGSPVGRA
jgi:hypothetical protein